jgi:flagellar biosynthesis/type III secretory pathway M-ring protein FliF/YscJ
VKKTRLPAGGVRKVSVAVLVDQSVNWVKEGAGYRRVLEPPAPEKLKIIRDLVAGIIGFTAERGDQLIVETLPFETTLLTEPPQSRPSGPAGPATPAMFRLDRRMITIGAAAAGGIIVLLLAGFLLSRRRKPRTEVEATAPAALPAAAETPGAVTAPPISVEKQLEAKLAERDALQEKMDEQALTAIKIAPVITKAAEVFAKHLREKIHQDPGVSAHILRSWIREEQN